MLRVIFFDAVGTLIHLPKGAAFHYCEVAQRHGLTLDEKEVASCFRAVWREMPKRNAPRVAREDDDRGWWAELVHRVLARAGGVSDRVFDEDAYFAELYEEFAQPGVWETFPDVLPALQRLSGRYRLGIISNFDGRLRRVLEHLRLSDLMSHIIISSEVGADKPDRWIFAEALKQSGVEPPEAMHVGDEPRADWEGAADAGFQVFKLQRPENSLFDLATSLGAGD